MFLPPGSTPRTGTAGSHGDSVFALRSCCWTVVHGRDAIYLRSGSAGDFRVSAGSPALAVLVWLRAVPAEVKWDPTVVVLAFPW